MEKAKHIPKYDVGDMIADQPEEGGPTVDPMLILAIEDKSYRVLDMVYGRTATLTIVFIDRAPYIKKIG